MTFNSEVNRIALPSKTTSVEPGTSDHLMLVGWGSLDTYGGAQSNILQEIEVKHISDEQCKTETLAIYTAITAFSEQNYCVKSIVAGGGSCSGDSGINCCCVFFFAHFFF